MSTILNKHGIRIRPDVNLAQERRDFYRSEYSVRTWAEERERFLPDLPTIYHADGPHSARKIRVGDEGTLVEVTSVRPDDMRRGDDCLRVYFDARPDGVPGNSNGAIQRLHGWRGTTNDSYVDASGWRRIEAITRRGVGWLVKISADLKPSQS